MLNCHGRTPAGAEAKDGKQLDGCVWLDLLDPTTDEKQRVENEIGLALPDRKQIKGFELSQRAAIDGDALRLNVPNYCHDDDLPPTALGLIVTPKHLVSLHYADPKTFEFNADELRSVGESDGSASAFATLTEIIVGRVADRLENIAADVGSLSARLFQRQGLRTRALRSILGDVGRSENRLAHARLTATGLLRIVMFAHDSGLPWIDKAHIARLKTAQKDLEVLCELDAQMTDKLQFLLDAALGFISIEQNDVMKIFTVASVAAIPPVILAGIWGMNFQHMPELHWRFGYPIALAVIVVSILVPMLWFKRRGWF